MHFTRLLLTCALGFILLSGWIVTGEELPQGSDFFAKITHGAIITIKGRDYKVYNKNQKMGLGTRDPRNPQRWLKQGTHYIVNEKGFIQEETPYVDDKIHGLKRTFYLNGKKNVEIVYVNGLKNGSETSYFDDGILIWRTSEFKDGRKNGLCTTMQKWKEISVTQFEKNYFENSLHGESLQYDDAGKKVVHRKVYNMNKLVVSEDAK